MTASRFFMDIAEIDARARPRRTSIGRRCCCGRRSCWGSRPAGLASMMARFRFDLTVVEPGPEGFSPRRDETTKAVNWPPLIR